MTHNTTHHIQSKSTLIGATFHSKLILCYLDYSKRLRSGNFKMKGRKSGVVAWKHAGEDPKANGGRRNIFKQFNRDKCLLENTNKIQIPATQRNSREYKTMIMWKEAKEKTGFKETGHNEKTWNRWAASQVKTIGYYAQNKVLNNSGWGRCTQAQRAEENTELEDMEGSRTEGHTLTLPGGKQGTNWISFILHHNLNNKINTHCGSHFMFNPMYSSIDQFLFFYSWAKRLYLLLSSVLLSGNHVIQAKVKKNNSIQGYSTSCPKAAGSTGN